MEDKSKAAPNFRRVVNKCCRTCVGVDDYSQRNVTCNKHISIFFNHLNETQYFICDDYGE